MAEQKGGEEGKVNNRKVELYIGPTVPTGDDYPFDANRFLDPDDPKPGTCTATGTCSEVLTQDWTAKLCRLLIFSDIDIVRFLHI